jgi:hypothetical protein
MLTIEPELDHGYWFCPACDPENQSLHLSKESVWLHIEVAHLDRA